MEPRGGPEPEILPAFFDNPAWYPGGKWIAVEHSDSVDTDGDGSNDEKFGGIWFVHAETAKKQPLLKGFGNPAWSPDGRKLAMERGGQIFTIEVTSLEPARVDTNSLVQLTTEGRNFFPAWGPDGEWLAYDSTIPVDSSGIWIIRPTGGSKTKVADGRYPDWSPDGNHILYLGLYREIYQVDINDTSKVIRLTSLNQAEIYATDNRNPKYSPDGTKIAFYSQPRFEAGAAIWVMNSDGSNLRQVSPEYAWRFDWSPDGRKFVFLVWDFLNERRGNGQLWLINTDGSGLRQLTHFSKQVILTKSDK